METGVCEPLNGVIRAIFKFGNIIMVGVELEDVIPCVPLNLTDGSFSGHRFFHCQEGKALFVEAECCHKDNRFSDDFIVESKVFGHAESPVVTENIPPISKLTKNWFLCSGNSEKLMKMSEEIVVAQSENGYVISEDIFLGQFVWIKTLA